ncbi:MAG TPA: hypothetical protein VI455_10015 [Terriglobia bacterium]
MFTKTRKTHKTIFAVSFALVAILASAISVAAQSSYHSLTMENNTGYDIYQVRLSPVNDPFWERDLLGTRVFEDGTSFTVTQISPGRYDIGFVDQDADVCVLHDVAIYNNLSWDLSQRWLLNCER